MAVYRPPVKCPFCGENIEFIPNPIKENFIGDTGGNYDFDGHYKRCKKQVRIDKIKKITDE